MTSRYRWQATYRNLAGDCCVEYSASFNPYDLVTGPQRTQFHRDDVLRTISAMTNPKLAGEAELVLVADDFTPTP